jgi:hypothetical protein
MCLACPATSLLGKQMIRFRLESTSSGILWHVASSLASRSMAWLARRSHTVILPSVTSCMEACALTFTILYCLTLSLEVVAECVAKKLAHMWARACELLVEAASAPLAVAMVPAQST